MDAQKNSALEAGAKVIDTNSQESGEARRARQMTNKQAYIALSLVLLQLLNKLSNMQLSG